MSKGSETRDRGREGDATNGERGSDGGSRPQFRPSFLDTEERPVPETQPRPQADVFFVEVTSNGTSETHRFDQAEEAQSFLEDLLNQGTPENEVAAFSGHRLAMKVSFRPVVHLNAGEEE